MSNLRDGLEHLNNLKQLHLLFHEAVDVDFDNEMIKILKDFHALHEYFHREMRNGDLE